MSEIGPGFNLGQYRIIEQIGKGGMATVYKAHHERLDRYVAIKVLPSFYADDATFVERFEQEAQLIARLRHHNILNVFDFGQQGNILFIVSEYVGGGTLKDKMGAPLPYEYVNSIAAQIASALDYAHSQGILHRDIKPSNILLTTEGTPVLSDFGLARILERSERLTQTSTALGTPEYMAPEQAMGQQVDRRADLYSFGIVLYEMLAGTVPYVSETPISVILAHVQQPLPSPRIKNPALSEPVEKLLIKALAKKPEERFQTVGELAQAIQQATQGSVNAPPQTIVTSATLPEKIAVTTPVTETVISQPVSQPEVITKRKPRLWLYGVAAVVVLAILGIAGFRFLRAPDGPVENMASQTQSVPSPVSGKISTPQPVTTPTISSVTVTPTKSSPSVTPVISIPPTITNTPPASSGSTPSQLASTPATSDADATSSRALIKAKLVIGNGIPLGNVDVNLYTSEAFSKGLGPLDTKKTASDGFFLFLVNAGDYVVSLNRERWPAQLPFPNDYIRVHVAGDDKAEVELKLNIGMMPGQKEGSTGMEGLFQQLVPIPGK